MYASNSLMDAQKHLTDNGAAISALERELLDAQQRADRDCSTVRHICHGQRNPAKKLSCSVHVIMCEDAGGGI